MLHPLRRLSLPNTFSTHLPIIHLSLPKISPRRQYTPGTHFYQNRILDPYLATPVHKLSLRQLVVFGRHLTNDKLLKSANYVRTELPVRLAHRIRDFQALPFIVGTNPHVQKVYDLYWSAFDTLRHVPEIKTLEQNQAYCLTLTRLLDQHLVVIPQLALGISECSANGVFEKRHADAFMNGVLRSRISRRVIAEQHIKLTAQFTGFSSSAEPSLLRETRKWEGLMESWKYAEKEETDEEWDWASKVVGAGLMELPTQGNQGPAKDGATQHENKEVKSSYPMNERDISTRVPPEFGSAIGIVRTHVHSGITALKCAKHTADNIREAYGGIEPPRVIVDGHTSATFAYIPDHIDYILFELLRNSMRATIDKNLRDTSRENLKLPPIRITIGQGEKDIVFRISDQGGGIPRQTYEALWSFSQVTPTCDSRSSSSDLIRSLHTPRLLATVRQATTAGPFGLGIGLNMSRVYANYWGGELSLFSVWGYGTDAYVKISRLGNQSENLEMESVDS